MGRRRKDEKRQIRAAKDEISQESEEIAAKIQLFYTNLKYLSMQYDRYNSRRAIYQQEFKDVLDAYIRWLHFDAESYEVNDFSGQSAQIIADPNFLWKALDTATFWKSYDVYKDLGLEWRLRYTDKARLKMLSYTANRRFVVLEKLFMLANGRIHPGANCEVAEIGPCSCMGSFITRLSPNDMMVWMIQLDRLPKLRNNRVVQYYFSHYLRVIDFVKSEKQATDAIRRYLSSIKGDSDRWIEPDLSMAMGTTEIHSFENIVQIKHRRALPKHFSTVYLSGSETDSIIYDSGRRRWVSSTEGAQRLNQPAVESYLTQLNSAMLSRLADFNSCQGFIRLLEAIPNFRIRLTEEERDLIGTPGDVLAIGRSGTGKTTCAVLRLFASEVLFKFRSQHVKAKRGLVLADTHFGPEDVDQRCGLHILFATASPVLTNEVKRFYWRLNDHIKTELMARNERRKQREEERKQELTTQYEAMDSDDEPVLHLEREISAEEEIKIRTEEEIMAEDAAEEEETGQEGDKRYSMAYLTDDDFPLFLTIRRLVFMIDATQKSPFFARSADGDIIGMTGKSEWHNEMKGVLMINSEYKRLRLEEETTGGDFNDSSSESEQSEEELDEASAQVIERTKALIQSHKYNLSKKWTRQLSFEVDYEYFAIHFWPKIVAKTHHNAIVIWTEIASYIKGSAESHKYPGWYLPKNTYLAMGRKKSLLSLEDKSTIWELFIEYERWKVRMGAYDFQDIVNYQLYFINLNGYRGIPIHYMMVDEVQDLTHCTLLLVAKVTEQSLFFSGDTAQTIAKGVGFRFCDLRSLFFHDEGLKVHTPVVKQLTVNFRSHGRILALANSVVSLIEAMFPETIDKLAKENSSIEGPKPMILTGNSMNELFLLLFGTQSQAKPDPSGLLTRPPIEFGCDQVIIVRSQEDKDRLPSELKGALCLTVYEVKGLEFDDVLLYNFFAGSEVPESQWRILNQIEFTGEGEKAVPTSLETLEEGPAYIRIKSANFDNSMYSMLCTELKMLYVAITRPRKRLIIYDQNSESFQFLLNYWQALNTINLLHFVEKPDRYDILSSTGEEVMGSIAESTGKLAWRAQGLRMMKHRFYEQAIKCFDYSGDSVLRQRAEAYSLANAGATLLTKTESDLEVKRASKAPITKAERRQVRTDKELALLKFAEAGKEFESLGLYKNAAKCYFSAKENAKAAQLFEQMEAWGQCAEAYLACGNYQAAGDMFLRTGEYLRAIEAYKVIRNWEAVLDCIHSNSEHMSREERETLVKKYIPIALEDLMPKVLLVQDDERQYSQMMEKEDAGKRPVVIKEEMEESDSEDSDTPPPLVPAESTLSVLGSNATVLVPIPAAEEVQDAESVSGSLLDISGSVDGSMLLVSAVPIAASNPFSTSTNPFAASTNPFASTLPAADTKSDSFSFIGSQRSEDLLSSNLEVLSHYDPDDEWLQVEKGSIVESLHTASKVDGTLFSEYSILDNAQAVALNQGGQLIQTKADIFVEDEIMRKILQYVSMFSEDVKAYLLSMKSAESLVQCQGLKADWRVFSIVDLDEIDLPLIGVTLDTLEFFELYKLCLVVCNRYQMAERLGRYVLSLAHKYSFMADMTKPLSQQKERAVVAYTALHNVFEMINPAILAPKPPTEVQSLGLNCFQGLLLMGYWKKCVYLLDRPNALAVASTWADFRNYKNVFLTLGTEAIPENIKEKVLQADFSWLPFETPDSPERIEALRMAIDEIVWSLNHLYPITLKSQLLTEEKQVKVPSYPSLVPFNQAFWRFVKERGQEQEKELRTCLTALPVTITSAFKQISFKSPTIQVRIHDCFSFLTQVLYASKRISPLRDLICNLSFEHFEDFAQAVNQAILILLMKSEAGFSVYHLDSLFGLLSPLGVRRILESPITLCLPLYSHALLHRSSLLFPTLAPACLPIDMEGDFGLCPINSIANLVAMDFTELLGALVTQRDSLYKEYENPPRDSDPIYPFISLEDLSKDERDLKSASCLFGEISQQEYIQLRFPTKFPFTVKSFKVERSDYEETEKEEVEKQLKSLMELGDSDAISMRYLMQTRGKQISQLERKLNRLTETDVESQVRSRLNGLIRNITFRMRWFITRPPVVTKSARNWLIRYAWDSVRQIDFLDEGERSETMAKAYYISSLCNSQLLLLDLIRAKGKPIFRPLTMGKSEALRKEAAISPRFNEDLAWLDLEVYFRKGAMAEAATTIFEFFKLQFFILKPERRFDLLTKAVVCSLMSSFPAITIPKAYASKLLRLSESTGFKYPNKVVKKPALAQIGRCLEWLSNLSDDFMQAFSRPEDPSSRRICKTYFSLLASVLSSVSDLNSIAKSWGTLKNSLATHFRTTYHRTIRALLEVGTNADLKQFVRNLDSPEAKELLVGPLVVVSCTQVKDEESAFAELDADWVTEVKQKATLTLLERSLLRLALAKKARSGRLRLRVSPRITEVTEYFGLTSVAVHSGTKLGESSGQVLAYWRGNRANMRLFASLTRNKVKLVGFNQTSLFENVLDRHFVLNQLFSLGALQELYQRELCSSLAGGSTLSDFVNRETQKVDGDFKAFVDWTNVVNSSRKYDLRKKPQKKWDAQWKVRFQKMRPKTGHKKQAYLQYRAQRLKGR